ncbi:MAG: CopD family protein [Motiliproteus sp.]|nr:CopD family protein [Motiliproteus sp.]MCW9053094.1 CopD family protein [Motiliproteus sp.]
MMILALPLHLLAAIVWIGGMLMMLFVVRPAAVESLQPPLRPQFLYGVLNRFFRWVWLSLALVIASGFWMVVAGFGGFANVLWPIHLMTALGLLMTAIFCWIYFVPFASLRKSINAERWPDAANSLESIRKLVMLNALLGVIIAVSVTAGRYL